MLFLMIYLVSVYFQWFVLLGFIVSLVFILAATYGTYDQVKEGGGLWDKPARVMYNTFARSAFALGLGFIVLICCTGNGGTNQILCNSSRSSSTSNLAL